MVNTRKKGQRTVLKGRKILEKQGYLTETVEKTGKYTKNKDLFNLFDLIAIKPNHTKLIQFKTNTKPTLKPYHAFAKTYPQFHIEIWTWYDYEDFTIFTIS